MGKLAQKKEEKRRAILGAAREVFLSEGYVAANMDQIAERAHVTKQTVYRYFSSKIELFQATLIDLGHGPEGSFVNHLENPDVRTALYDFAVGFIQAHLSKRHLATYRLLVAESGRAPELAQAFFSVGPDPTRSKLSAFFSERLGIAEPETLVRLWTGMLLAYRSQVLVGREPPNETEIANHAEAAAELLLQGTGFDDVS